MNTEHTDLSNYSKHFESVTWRKNGEQVKENCKKYLRYFDKSQALNVAKPKYDICILLNYWIYGKLTKIFGAKDTSDNINIAFGNLQYMCSKLCYYPSNMEHRNKYKPKFETVNHQNW